MTEEQLQVIKENFVNTPDGYTISGSVRLIEQMKDNGIALAEEVELQKANAEQYLQDNVVLHNENLILNNENQRLSSALDCTELAEAKARVEIERLRKGISDLRIYIGYQRHSDLSENIVDILYKILNGENEDGESNE